MRRPRTPTRPTRTQSSCSPTVSTRRTAGTATHPRSTRGREKLCDDAKAANITIYTVQVNTGGDATSGVLQYCASSTDKFYLISSASQTVSVFKNIGTSLSKLRLAR
jgi:hypothetical protein